MGRLRHDFENPLFQGIAEEVTDLFGEPDCFLFRFDKAGNNAVKDPLWGEPTTTAKFVKYPVKMRYSEYVDETESGYEGRDMTTTLAVQIALNHLLKAQVPPDVDAEYVTDGDVVGLHWRGEYIELDVTQCSRAGFVNNSDKFTGYELECTRRDKYVSERKTGDENQ